VKKPSWALFLLLLVSCAPVETTPATRVPEPVQPTSAPVETPGLPPSDAATAAGGCLPSYAEPDPVVTMDRPGLLWGVEAADFNDDGWADIVVWRAEFQSGDAFEIDILLNDGAGNLVVGTEDVFVGNVPRVVEGRELVIADFNGDRRPDLFFADQGMDRDPFPGHQNTLVLSAPDGKMVDASGNLPQQSDQTHSAAAADIDSDGDVDLWVGNLGGGGVRPQLLINDGAGVFVPDNSRIPNEHLDGAINWYTSAAFADINSDGSPDLILGQGNPSRDSHVLVNDGAGRFYDAGTPLPRSFFYPAPQVVEIQAADIDGDELPDIVLSDTRNDYSGKYIQVNINNGDNTFRDETETWLVQVTAGSWVIWLDLLDIDMDGDVDLIESPMGGSKPNVYLNVAGRAFSRTSHTFNISSANLFAFVDLDNDGLLDVVWSHPPCEGGACPETHHIVRAYGCP
jgi:hypothetical protein